MKSVIFGLSAVSAAAAQIVNGFSMVSGPSTPVLSQPTPTATVGGAASVYAPPSQPTAAPSYSNFYDYMPYTAYQSGGYKSLDCGYGYSKQSDGSCSPESWVRPAKQR